MFAEVLIYDFLAIRYSQQLEELVCLALYSTFTGDPYLHISSPRHDEGSVSSIVLTLCTIPTTKKIASLTCPTK